MSFEFFGRSGVASAFSVVSTESCFEHHWETNMRDSFAKIAFEGYGFWGGCAVGEIGLALEEFVLDCGKSAESGDDAGWFSVGDDEGLSYDLGGDEFVFKSNELTLMDEVSDFFRIGEFALQ